MMGYKKANKTLIFLPCNHTTSPIRYHNTHVIRKFEDFFDDGLVEYLDVKEENDAYIAWNEAGIDPDNTTYFDIEPFIILEEMRNKNVMFEESRPPGNHCILPVGFSYCAILDTKTPAKRRANACTGLLPCPHQINVLWVNSKNFLEFLMNRPFLCIASLMLEVWMAPAAALSNAARQ
uniref:RNA polymerase Rpb2 domain-containing protein n=1 Tax=Glossina pallidipes TaxID=7398 RepID=A0A1B0AFP1_GLOPL